MKKFIATSLATFVLISFGSVFAQGSQSHDVEINLPGVLMLRLVDGTSNNPVTNPTSVIFDLSALDEGTFDPEGTYAPTNTSFNWNDVAVFSNGGAWEVTIDLDSPVGTFDWSKVSVPAGTESNAFSLVNDALVAEGTGRTGGFLRLGFGPAAFALDLDGTEDSGDYEITVIYSIATP